MFEKKNIEQPMKKKNQKRGDNEEFVEDSYG